MLVVFNLIKNRERVIANERIAQRLTEEEIIAHLQGIDGLIAGLEPLNRRVIESAPQLKAIARVGIGVANVDFDAARGPWGQGVQHTGRPRYCGV